MFCLCVFSCLLLFVDHLSLKRWRIDSNSSLILHALFFPPSLFPNRPKALLKADRLRRPPQV